MKKTFLFVFIFQLFSAIAQSNYPLLPTLGNSFQAFIPQDWTLINIANGDINKDGKEDIVFVIEKNFQSSTENNESKIKKLRILSVLIQDKNKIYNKIIQSNSFIIAETPNSDKEPYEGIKITDDGIVEIAFQVWQDTDFKILANYLYRFSLLNNNLALIGFNQISTNRFTGDTTEFLIDFKNKKLTNTVSNYLEGTSNPEKIIKIEINNLKTITELQQPFMWNFYGLNI